MQTRILEGYEISDEGIYAFGDLTAVVTFSNGQIGEIYVGATFGDYSDAALYRVITTGQPLTHVQGWLSHIIPDASAALLQPSTSVVKAIMGEGAQTFSGLDGTGKAWLIGFDGQEFGFVACDNDDADAIIVPAAELRIVGKICITTPKFHDDRFVINSPTEAMTTWLRAKLESVNPAR